MKKDLTIERISKRTGYTVGTLHVYSREKSFPPPRRYGPYGRKFWRAEDIDAWFAKRPNKRGR